MANTTWSTTDKSPAITLTGGNLTATASTNSGVRTASAFAIGQYYWEITLNTFVSANTGIGVAVSTAVLATVGATPASAALVRSNGNIWVAGVNTGSSLGALSNGNVMGFAIDVTAQLIWFRVSPSGNWNGSGTANPATATGGISVSGLTGALYPIFGAGGNAESVTANFGDSVFSGAVPAGFTAGCPVFVSSATNWNPADKSGNITLTNGNLTATWNASAGSVRSTVSKTTGKFYFEVTHNVVRVVAGIGLANAFYVLTGFTNTANTIYARMDALTIQGNGTNLGSSNNFPTAGQVASFAVDLGATLFWTRVQGGNWNNNATNNPATGVGGISFSYLAGPFFVLAGGAAGTAGEQTTLNVGTSAFTYTIPSGFQAWDAPATVQARALIMA